MSAPLTSCKMCGRKLPEGEFYKRPSGEVRKPCKDCSRAQMRAYARAHPREAVARGRVWRSKDPEYVRQLSRRRKAANREHIRKQAREYYWKDADASRARARRYKRSPRSEEAKARRRATRAEENARARERYALNPTQRKRSTGRSRARRLKRDQWVKPYTEILRHDPCSYCGHPSEQVDHVVSLAQGGSNDWDNLTAACGSCNRRKAAGSLLLHLAGLP